MKKIKISCLILLLIVCIFIVAACNSNGLSSPDNFKFVNNNTITWRAVENARGYTVEINGQSQDIRRPEFSVRDFGEGEYTVRVKARGNGDEYSDSDWTYFTFEKLFETGLEFELMSNGEYSVKSIGYATGALVIDDNYKGRPVTKINDQAFRASSKITSVVIGKNIKSIGDGAFQNCGNIETVVFNDVLTYIGKKAFSGCYKIQSISFPDSVTEISESAFEFCRGLSNIKFGAKLQTIGVQAFKSCTGITEIDLPSGLKLLGDNAFEADTVLQSVSLGGDDLSIGNGAFKGCKQLKTVNMRNGIKSIGDEAFYSCESLTDIVIPDSVLQIGTQAFCFCDKLNNVTLGSNVKMIGNGAFSRTAFWESISEEENFVIIDRWIVDIKDRNIVNLNILDYDVVGIASFVFSMCHSLRSCMLPDNLVWLNSYAFYNCEMLSSVLIGDKVKEIGVGAFYNCKNMNYVNIGRSVEIIGSMAFYGCEKLGAKNINIPSDSKIIEIGSNAFGNTAVETAGSSVYYVGNWVVGSNENLSGVVQLEQRTIGIADYAFINRVSVTGINIPDTVEYIGRSAFRGCKGIQQFTFPERIKSISDGVLCGSGIRSIEIPSGAISIGAMAFANCYNLKEAIIFDSVIEINNFAFYACINMDSLSLGNSIQAIGACAFSNCESLESVKLPDSLRTIGERAFYRCYKLYDLDLGNGVGTIGERAFYQCVALPSLVLPDSVTSIGDYAFYKCTNMATVKFGARVENIGKYAFYKCTNLLIVEMPDSLTTIGDFAFRGCIALRSVALGGSVTSIGEHAFYGCQQTTIYCETSGIYNGWSSKWNSSYRPVVWNCVFSVDNDYVESVIIAKDGISNFDAVLGITEPVRMGYVFVGWSKSADGSSIDYSASMIADVQEGTTLYSVWREKTEDELAAENPEPPKDLNASVFG